MPELLERQAQNGTNSTFSALHTGTETALQGRAEAPQALSQEGIEAALMQRMDSFAQSAEQPASSPVGTPATSTAQPRDGHAQGNAEQEQADPDPDPDPAATPPTQDAARQTPAPGRPRPSPFAGRLLEVKPDGILSELKALPQWVMYGAKEELEQDGSTRIAKPPFYSPEPRYPNSPRTIFPAAPSGPKMPKCIKPFQAVMADLAWAKGREVVLPDRDTGELKFLGWIHGPGIVLQAGNGLVGIDVDHCLPKPEGLYAAEIQGCIDRMKALGFPLEVSPSGTGLRSFAYGSLPGKGSFKSSETGVEIYSQSRFLTVTGHHVEGTARSIVKLADNPEAQAVVDDLLRLAQVSSKGKKAAAAQAKETATETPTKKKGRGRPKKPSAYELALTSDDYLIEQITAREPARSYFLIGYCGANQSDADMSLVNVVTFYAKDYDRIDRIMRRSALLADPARLAKWDEPNHRASDGATYGRATIENALATQRNKFFIDYLAEQERTRKKAPAGEPELREDGTVKPVIQLEPGKKVAISRRLVAGLDSGDVYQNADGKLIRIRELPEDEEEKIRGDDCTILTKRGNYVVDILDEETLNEEIEERFTCQRWDKKAGEWLVTDLPNAYAAQILKLKKLKGVRLLLGIIRTPVIDLKGNVRAAHGYCPNTGFLHLLSPDLQDMTFDENNPPMTLQEAFSTLLDVLVDFPFADNGGQPYTLPALEMSLLFTPGPSFSVAIAYLLTIPIRSFLPTCPLFAFSANTAGTGKSSLAELAGLLGQGAPQPAVGYSADSETFKKALFAALLDLPQYLNLDNVPDALPVNNELLNRVLTQTSISERVLGVSKNATLKPRALMSMTGNHLVLTQDMTRRTLLCSMATDMECPEEREFVHPNFYEWVLENRRRILTAILTILRLFLCLPTEKRKKLLEADLGYKLTGYAGFKDWSDAIRLCVISLGLPDPLASQKTIRASDPLREALENVLTAWEATGEKIMTPSEMITYAGLKAALFDAIGAKREEELTNKRISGWLTRRAGVVLNGRRLVRKDQNPAYRQYNWALEKI